MGKRMAEEWINHIVAGDEELFMRLESESLTEINPRCTREDSQFGVEACDYSGQPHNDKSLVCDLPSFSVVQPGGLVSVAEVQSVKG